MKTNTSLAVFGLVVCAVVIGTQLAQHKRIHFHHEHTDDSDHPSFLKATTQNAPPKVSIGLPLSVQESSHWCHSRDFLSDSFQRATCLFQNICVVPRTPSKEKPQEVEFIYLSNNNNNNNNNTEEVDPKEIEFTLAVAYHRGDKRIRFTPTIMTKEAFLERYSHEQQQHGEIRYIHGIAPIVYEFNSENFGHMLTDVLLPMYAALDAFSMTQRQDLQLFRLSIKDAIGWSCDYQQTHTGYKFGKAGPACNRMYSIFQQLTPGHAPLQVLNATDMQPTCFQSAIVGMVNFGDDCNSKGDHGKTQDYFSLCNVNRQNQFWNFRNWMLRNAGVSLAQPTKHKITITNTTGGRINRSLRNLDDLVTTIQQTYPTMQVVVANWAQMTIQEQFELIRTTTVHITPPGGVSYISILLPRWATSIRLYNQDLFNDWHIFHYLGYMTVEHIDCQHPMGLIPIDTAMDKVEKSLQRYKTFRKAQDPLGWLPNQ